MQDSYFKLQLKKWIIYIFTIFALFSFSQASRLWGVIKKENKPLIVDYSIIYKQLLELQMQGNLGNFADWPYNSDDGWGLVKYSGKTLTPNTDIFNSPIPAIQDEEFIHSINSILDYSQNTRIALGHVRKSTSGSFSIPNPHPFNFNHLNKTYSFAHNGTIDKSGLISLITDNGIDSSWIRLNPPDSYNCGNWETNGFDCVVDSELYFLWIMKNIIDIGDDLKGILNAIQVLESTEFEVDEYYGEQRNFIFSNGLELFAYKSADNITGENRHELFYKSYDNHFSVMSTPFSVDSGYIALENQELLILSEENINPIVINTNFINDGNLDIQILQNIINLNNLDELNCVSCNNNGILEPDEFGTQEWEENDLILLDLSNYSSNQLKYYPSSIKLLSSIENFSGPNSHFIPQVTCNELPEAISSFLQCSDWGCTDPISCNYNSFSINDNGSCIYTNTNYTCDEDCIFDFNNDGNCNNILELGCTDSSAINFNSNAIENQFCLFDNIILLKKGNNLISIPIELENNNTMDILNQLHAQQININFILGQGVGIFNVDNNWSGNLHNLHIGNGYWINTQTNFAWHVQLDSPPLSPNECIEYNLNEGNNLISYTGPENNSTIHSLNGDDFSNNFNFILGQSVGLFNTDQGWAGNLYNLSRKKGYWINSFYPMNFYWGDNCEESIIIDSLNYQFSNNIFNVNQSINQSFYLIKGIKFKDLTPSEFDYVLAFHEGELIGSTKYSNDLTILPIMGRDESNHTINYINSGETPVIKFYQESTDKFIELKGEIPNFKNLSVNLINELESKNKSIPNKVELFSIYPNPFNPTTQVNYSLDESYNVKINVFDINGKVVENIISKIQNSGNYSILWNAKNNSSGIYFVKLIAENNFKRFSQTQKIMLIK